MGFELLCATLIALMVGAVICFGGYRFFMFVLPFWAFLYGFALGAATLQAIFGIGFLATVTSWIAGFVVGAVFALLSYLFYTFAVGILAGSLGYGLGVGFMNLIGINFGLLVWLVGIVVGVILALVTIFLRIDKWVIIIASAIGGAGQIVITMMFGYAGLTLANLVENPIRIALQGSPLWAIFFIVLVVAGIVVQLGTSRAYELEPYGNRI